MTQLPSNTRRLPILERKYVMIQTKTVAKLLAADEEEFNKIIDKMTEKNAKDTLKIALKFIKEYSKSSL